MKYSLVILMTVPALAIADDRPPIATDRPGFSDGSNVVGKGTLQMEAGFFRTFAQNQTTTSVGDLLFRYGTSKNSEIRIIGFSYGFAPGDVKGFLDPSVGFKYRLIEPEGKRGELTFIGQTTFPIGSSPLRSNAWNPTAKLAYTMPVGSDTLGSNLVYSKNGSGASRFDQTALSIFFSRPMSSKFSLIQEIWGVNRVGVGGSGGAYTSLAAAYLLNNYTQLDVRIGTAFNQARDGWFIQGGYSRRF